ncbi:pyridoxine 5'-phosphate synthase [Marinicella sp. W31]|uniref:pyridoxine 5'-phosphate synthase n=1 Tax=Marinicella sp. W31 TaxID=3023713 RepID=UPI0037562E82
MTSLSVNLNKIALLRNARGRDYPNVIDFAQKMIDLGVQGITVHPRQDERHATRQDTRDLAELIKGFENVEFNVEGYPSDDFMALIEETRPDQCTLVPDGPDQITSDHGWDMHQNATRITALGAEFKRMGVRSSVFLDPDVEQVTLAADCGIDRIELYTEKFAVDYLSDQRLNTFNLYKNAAKAACKLGLGVNAGHDLDLNNLAYFLQIPEILEVSIGHALTVECLEQGMHKVVVSYLQICQQAAN